MFLIHSIDGYKNKYSTSIAQLLVISTYRHMSIYETRYKPKGLYKYQTTSRNINENNHNMYWIPLF